MSSIIIVVLLLVIGGLYYFSMKESNKNQSSTPSGSQPGSPPKSPSGSPSGPAPGRGSGPAPRRGSEPAPGTGSEPAPGTGSEPGHILDTTNLDTSYSYINWSEPFQSTSTTWKPVVSPIVNREESGAIYFVNSISGSGCPSGYNYTVTEMDRGGRTAGYCTKCPSGYNAVYINDGVPNNVNNIICIFGSQLR